MKISEKVMEIWTLLLTWIVFFLIITVISIIMLSLITTADLWVIIFITVSLILTIIGIRTHHLIYDYNRSLKMIKTKDSVIIIRLQNQSVKKVDISQIKKIEIKRSDFLEFYSIIFYQKSNPSIKCIYVNRKRTEEVIKILKLKGEKNSISLSGTYMI